jgi:hypothetical protein
VLLARTRLIFTTPALRARMVDSQHATEKLFAESLAARDERAQEATLEIRVQAAATLAALTVALSAWVQSDGAEQLACTDRSCSSRPTSQPRKPAPEPTMRVGSLLLLRTGGTATTTQRDTGL